MILYLFWLSSALIICNYLLYPIVIYSLSLIIKQRIKNYYYQPSVSFIIAAYNESDVIEKKIENTLKLRYPSSRLEIIVVSDGSTDDTFGKVLRYKEQNVISLHTSGRKGKTSALNRAVEQAKNEIIVFSDANNFFHSDALLFLCQHFYDSKIGGVCGIKKIKPHSHRESSTGDGFFWKYESFIKKIESSIGSIVGADGEIFAIRKKLYTPIKDNLINDDAAITLELIKRGYRVIYETKAESIEYASVTLRDDYNVKVRMVAGGFQTVFHYHNFLFNLFRQFQIQFFFHKILRWLMPQFLILLFFTNISLTESTFYRYLLFIQLTFYGFALAGLLLHKINIEIKFLYLPFYFCFMNFAALMGFVAFIRLEKMGATTLWKKARR